MEFIDNTTPSFEQYQQNMPYTFGATNPDKRDMFREWAQMYYPNAFQAALLNYQNEYDRPINQMLRYQEAGLNPYSFQPSQSSTGSAGSKPGVVSQTASERIKNAISGVQTTVDAARTASELYDYLKYGRWTSYYNMNAAQYQASIKGAEADWSNYWNYGPGYGSNAVYVEGSPRARYMEGSTQRIEAQVAQLNYLVDSLYPSQEAANQARAALQDYTKQIQQGNYDAILQIDTGNKTADTILRMLAMMLLNNMPSIGFSHKF